MAQYNPQLSNFDPYKILRNNKTSMASPNATPNISVAQPTSNQTIKVASPSPTPNVSVAQPTPLPEIKVSDTPATPNISVAQPTVGAGSYTVQSGDTLSAIARNNNMSLADVLALNPQYQTNPNLIRPGETIKLSNQAVTPTITPTTPTPQAGGFQTSTGEIINPNTGGVATPPTPATSPTTPTTPTTPTPQPETELTPTQLAERSIEELLRPSEEEIKTQEELDRLQESFSKAYTGESQRTIPLEFITGRQRALEQRALDLAQPLQNRMALLEAKRTGALEASKFKLGRLDKEAEIAREASAPAEGFTLGKDQVRYDASGNVIASNLGSEGLSGGFGGAGYVPGENPTVDGWVNLINSGQASIANVPTDELKNAVANALTAGGSSETDQVKAEILRDKINTIEDLLDHRGMSKSVGPSGLARWTPFKIDTWSGDTQDFISKVHQLTSQETLDYLINIKAQGGTFGALSEKELSILQDSASLLNDREIKDGDGNPTGKWNMSEKSFKDELTKLQTLTEKAYDRATGADKEPVTDLARYKRVYSDEFNSKIAPVVRSENLDQEETLQLINRLRQTSFNKVGGDTNIAIPQSSRLAYVNNNPGNLRYVGQAGATQGEGGFARFSSPQAGYQALKNQISLDASRGLTLSQFINKYAPPIENATSVYLSQISSRLGVNPSTKISSINLDNLAKEIARKESSTVIS